MSEYKHLFIPEELHDNGMFLPQNDFLFYMRQFWEKPKEGIIETHDPRNDRNISVNYGQTIEELQFETALCPDKYWILSQEELVALVKRTEESAVDAILTAFALGALRTNKRTNKWTIPM